MIVYSASPSLVFTIVNSSRKWCENGARYTSPCSLIVSKLTISYQPRGASFGGKYNRAKETKLFKFYLHAYSQYSQVMG